MRTRAATMVHSERDVPTIRELGRQYLYNVYVVIARTLQGDCRHDMFTYREGPLCLAA